MLLLFLFLTTAILSHFVPFLKAEDENLPAEYLMPSIGLGTAGLREKTADIVRIAVQAFGVRLIDTAQAAEWYSEEGVRDGLLECFRNFNGSRLTSESLSTIVIVTKIHPRSFSLDKMRQRLEQSIRYFHDTFKTDSLEPAPFRTELVVLLHSPRCWSGHCTKEEEAVSWRTGWKNLETLKREWGNAIKAIGVSNFHSDELRELVLQLANERVSVIQNWMDPFNHDWETRSFAAEHRIQAYSSFGTQWLGRKFPEDHNPVFYNPLLQRLADKHQADIAQVVLAWVMSSGAVAIPRASQPEHLRANFEFLLSPQSLGRPVQLSEEDMQEIGQLDGILGEPWDE